MPEWKFPISLPKFTDPEYETKKTEYIAKHGYFVSPPKLGDIIHIGISNEPTDQEWQLFKQHKVDELGELRHQEIIDILNKKRDRRDRMLASPTPTWGQNIASVMTFFDDINDTLGSVAVLGRFAARLLPKALGRVMLGPVGWLLMAADIAGLALDIMRLPVTCIGGKRRFESVRDVNPFSQRAKTRRASKLRRILPGKGEVIEMLQTTDNVFGIGLCLGPILGYGYDVASGIVRSVRGEKVTWRSPPPRKPNFIQAQQRCLRFAQMVHLAKEEMTDEDHLAMMLALNGATQVLKPWIDEWNPIDEVDGLQHALLQAPTPLYPTTLEILKEIGVPPGQNIGWPGLDKTHAGLEELWDTCQSTAALGFTDFAKRNRNSYVGACGCQNGYDFGKNMMLLLEGYETVLEQMTDEWQGYYNFFQGGCRLIGCGSAARGGCRDGKTHIISFGRDHLEIGGCAHNIKYISEGRKNTHLGIRCRNCSIMIPTSLCPAGYQKWVTVVGIAIEE